MDTVRYQAPMPPALNNDLFQRYLSFLDVSEASASTYRRALKRFSEYLSLKGINAPTREDLLDYRRELISSNLTASTVQSYVNAVRLFFAWLENENLYPNIALHLKSIRVDQEFKKDYLTADQVKRVLACIDDFSLTDKRDKAMIALMVCTGLRCTEIKQAEIDDMRAVGSVTALFVHGKGRSDKSEFVVVPSEVEILIRDYLSARPGGGSALFASTSNNNCGQPLTTRSISAIVKQRLKNAGFESSRLTAHSLRHTAATLALLNEDIRVDEAQQFLRHKSIQSTLIYSHALSREQNPCSKVIAGSIF